MTNTKTIFIELSDEADQFYLLNVDLENASKNGLYCRIPKIKPVQETRTYLLDLGKLESFNLL